MKRKKSKPITLAQANDRLIKQGPSPMAKLVIEQEGIKLAVSQCGQSIETIRSDVAALSKKIELLASDSSAHLSIVTSSFQKLVADIGERVSDMEKCIPQTCSPAPEVSRGRQLARKFIDRCSIAPGLPVDKNAQGSFGVAFLEKEIAQIVDDERQRIIDYIDRKITVHPSARSELIGGIANGFDYRDDQ